MSSSSTRSLLKLPSTAGKLFDMTMTWQDGNCFVEELYFDENMTPSFKLSMAA
tara:strand:- start:239 stop:397 length:159 start_codon:yes stop_codon:yes gene_type:complete